MNIMAKPRTGRAKPMVHPVSLTKKTRRLGCGGKIKK